MPTSKALGNATSVVFAIVAVSLTRSLSYAAKIGPLIVWLMSGESTDAITIISNTRIEPARVCSSTGFTSMNTYESIAIGENWAMMNHALRRACGESRSET